MNISSLEKSPEKKDCYSKVFSNIFINFEKNIFFCYYYYQKKIKIKGLSKKKQSPEVKAK